MKHTNTAALRKATATIGLTRQQGVVTLMMAMVLLVATTLLSIYSTRSAVQEQRIAANEYRAMEVDQASAAGLDYALIWLGTSGNSVTWAAGTDATCVGAVDEIGSIAGPAITAANSDSYNLGIVFCRNAAVNTNVIQVTATATAASDASISRTSRVFTRAQPGPMKPSFPMVPLVVGGCLFGANGSPDIWPEPAGVAIETRVGSVPCIDTSSKLGLDGEGSITPAGIIDDPIPVAIDLWDYVFAMSRAEIQAAAAQEVADGIADPMRKFVWVTSTANWHRDIGSPTNFAVVVFTAAADCPKMNGSVQIYGIVFVDSDCDKANGWGGSDIYGSAVVNGNIGATQKLNANTNFRHEANLTALATPTFPSGFAPREIGTWSDF